MYSHSVHVSQCTVLLISGHLFARAALTRNTGLSSMCLSRDTSVYSFKIPGLLHLRTQTPSLRLHNCLSYFTAAKISFTSILVFILVYICFVCTVYFSAFCWNPIVFKVSSWTNRFTFILEMLTRSSRSLIREQDSTCMCQPYFTLYLASFIMSLFALLTFLAPYFRIAVSELAASWAPERPHTELTRGRGWNWLSILWFSSQSINWLLIVPRYVWCLSAN